MKILVCTDGQPHSNSAIDRAIEYGIANSAYVTGLFVADSWLQKFYAELYAQGRKQYLDYVHECLQAQGTAARKHFTMKCRAADVSAEFRLRNGDPLAEILEQVGQDSPDVLITGRKRLGRWGRFRSRNLPLQLSKALDCSAELISVAEAA